MDDIMEEVARMYGFENFEATPILASFDGAINQLDVDIDREIREYLAQRCGMSEIYTYPWVQDEYLKATLQNEDELLSLAEPPSPNENYLRSSHVPNLCKAVHDNLRFFDEFSIFESAMVFFNRDFSAKYDERESLPLQRKSIAGALVADYESVNILFRKAKGIIEALPRYVHIESFVFVRNEKPVWADNVMWLNISCDNNQIGSLALLSKKVSLNCGIKNNAVIIFEIDLDSLIALPSRTNKFSHIPAFPMNEYDLSMLFDLSVKWDEIENVINSKRGSDSLVRDVTFIDEYRGKQVPEGKKSISFRLTIGSLTKTLASDEIEKCAYAVQKRLKKTLGAELRS
jgi:phenylalanyl-tRNA synthetase beta chain